MEISKNVAKNRRKKRLSLNTLIYNANANNSDSEMRLHLDFEFSFIFFQRSIFSLFHWVYSQVKSVYGNQNIHNQSEIRYEKGC